jgi:uncharacterized damage-inducible protein DinB/GNAT superfamily N-acetyltransferase
MPAVPERIELRRLAARDSLDALTELLHRAYAPLVERGMNFTAATQDVATTQRRIAEGQCFVAEQRGRIVGTVTVCGPYDVNTARWAAPVKAFRDRDTAHFHQFAVEPGMQRRGIGRRLVAACEQWARERGYKRLALDTAEGATELRALYRHLGYIDADRVQWAGKTYASVIMDKALDHSPLRAQLRLLARYNLWATQELCRHVDALPEADYRRDVGLFFKSVHGTLNHLLVTENLLWYRRFAEGISPALALDTEAEPDRDALRERLVDGALAWLPLIEVWPESRLTGQISYTSTQGRALTLPFAGTLTHVFNHGTHHRGQVSAGLTMLGRPAPVLDLAQLLVQESEAPA